MRSCGFSAIRRFRHKVTVTGSGIGSAHRDAFFRQILFCEYPFDQTETKHQTLTRKCVCQANIRIIIPKGRSIYVKSTIHSSGPPWKEAAFRRHRRDKHVLARHDSKKARRCRHRKRQHTQQNNKIDRGCGDNRLLRTLRRQRSARHDRSRTHRRSPRR